MSRNGTACSGKFKWVITYLLIAVLMVGFVGMTFMFIRKDKTKELTIASYEVGDIADTGKAIADSDGAIRTKEFINSDGLKVEIGKDATVTYSVYFYDKDKVLISVTDKLSTNYYGVIPKDAKYAKVKITPTADEDGKISETEIRYYAAQLTVMYNR